jgi:hypothetical protein
MIVSSSPDVTRAVKLKRMNWKGQIARVEEMINP